MIFHHDDQLFAQQESNGIRVNTTLLATDQQQSVLHVLAFQPTPPIAYSPYGHRPSDRGMLSLLEFNGERRDPITGYYLLGNGHRAFNPVLMRFNTADKLSPFGLGGLNCYAYCSGNPIGRQDRNGRNWRSVLNVPKKTLKRLVRGAQLPDSKANPTVKTPSSTEPTLYKNTRPERFSSELEAFEEAIKTDPFELISVTSAQDLKHLGGSLPRRFVLTANNQLLIDPSIDLERRGINHAILASYGGSGSGVLSAGTISASTKQAKIWNDSGHYRPLASALEPVAKFLNNLGVEVTSIRMY
jgi:RHS repeat-associated protein